MKRAVIDAMLMSGLFCFYATAVRATEGVAVSPSDQRIQYKGRIEHPEFIRRFGKEKPSARFIIRSYIPFIQKIRVQFPEAYILCVLGNMDVCRPESPWPGYIQRAASSMKDLKVYTHIFPY